MLSKSSEVTKMLSDEYVDEDLTRTEEIRESETEEVIPAEEVKVEKVPELIRYLEEMIEATELYELAIEGKISEEDFLKAISKIKVETMTEQEEKKEKKKKKTTRKKTTRTKKKTKSKTKSKSKKKKSE